MKKGTYGWGRLPSEAQVGAAQGEAEFSFAQELPPPMEWRRWRGYVVAAGRLARAWARRMDRTCGKLSPAEELVLEGQFLEAPNALVRMAERTGARVGLVAVLLQVFADCYDELKGELEHREEVRAKAKERNARVRAKAKAKAKARREAERKERARAKERKAQEREERRVAAAWKAQREGVGALGREDAGHGTPDAAVGTQDAGKGAQGDASGDAAQGIPLRGTMWEQTWEFMHATGCSRLVAMERAEAFWKEKKHSSNNTNTEEKTK